MTLQQALDRAKGKTWFVRCAENPHVWGPFTRDGAEGCLENWRAAWPRNTWEIVNGDDL